MFFYTKAQVKTLQKKALGELVEYAGGRSHLAKMLDIPLSTINSWIDRGMISVRGSNRASDNPTLSADFPKSRLRPDL